MIRKKDLQSIGHEIFRNYGKKFLSFNRDPVSPRKKTNLEKNFSIFLLFLTQNDQKKIFQSVGHEIYRKNENIFLNSTGTKFPLGKKQICKKVSRFSYFFLFQNDQKNNFHSIGHEIVRNYGKNFLSFNRDPVSPRKKTNLEKNFSIFLLF